MGNITLTLKNYRCFEERKPAVIELGEGFTSFVGPNNSGKSSLLKLIYEFRDIFGLAMHEQQTKPYDENDSLISYNFGGRLQSVQDNAEIFCNSNNSMVTIEFSLNPTEFKESDPATLTKMRFELKKGSPWPCSVFYEWTPKMAYLPAMIGKRFLIQASTKKIVYPKGGNQIIADCEQIFTQVENLCNSIYIGAFRNAINEGGGDYFDIALGTSFISIWNSWKIGSNKTQNNRIMSVTDDIRKLLGFKSLEINASDDKKTLQVFIDNKPYLLREIGAGMAQLIVVLANAAIRNPAYILIDEPELNLHPSLQADFLTSLASYGHKGVLFATHSIGLARSHSERIHSVQVRDGAHIVKPLENTPRYSEFMGEMGFSSYQEMGFEAILFVEGVKDVKTFQQFLRKIGIDHKVVILPLGGDSLARRGIEEELAEVLRITKTVFAVVDSEREAGGQQPNKNRQDFQKVCKKLRINILVTERRAIENYLSDRAIKEEKGPKYSVLGEYEKLGSNPISWGKSENWRIARKMSWDELKTTDVGKFLRSLQKKLEKQKK